MALNTVKATINGQVYTLNYNASSGKYEATITAPTGSSYNVNQNHYYPITIEAVDTAGNKTTVDDQTPTLGENCRLTVKEKVKPTISITSPGAGANLTTNKPTISFQLRDNDSGIKLSTLALKVNGSAAVGSTATGMTCTAVAGGYNCTYVIQSALTDGNNTISIDVQDNDGNIATTASVTFKVDTIPPVLNITSPANNLLTNKVALSVAGQTSDAGSSPVTVTIKLNGIDQGTITIDASGNFNKPLTLVSGANTIVIKSVDSAGKSTEITRSVTLDTTPPQINSVEITPNPLDAGATFIIKVVAVD